MRTPDSAPGALPEGTREHSRRLSGSTPGGYPGALPEATREHSRSTTRDLSQGAVLEVLRTSGTAPRAARRSYEKVRKPSHSF